MEFIEKLLDGVEVEWLPFSEVGEFLRGKRFVKADMMSEGVPCIHYGEMYTHFGIWADQTKSFLDEDLASKLRVANTGDVIIVAAGETIEDIGNGTAWLGVDDVVFHDACFSFKSTLDPKYVSYYLRTTLFKDQIKKSVSSGKISSINAKGLGKAEIPIPCPDNPKKSLEIQAEIVRILDAFTAMTAELTAELNLRRQQYNYYRDLLLSEAELRKVGFEWKLLGEVSQYEQPTKYLVESTNYDDSYSTPVLTAGKTFILGYTDEDEGIYEASSDPVIIFDDFTTANKWVDFDFKAKSSAMKMITSADENGVLTKYIYYWLNTVPSGLVEGDHKRQWIQNYCNKKIPIPSLEEQARIVAMLDKFDTLTSSISEGLPREIELRQKQYEYYRDLLLSFPKSEAA